jgi:hypothetical protein
MTRHIRLYVEGGGDLKGTIVRFRTALGAFFNEIRSKARVKKIQWTIKPCGGRHSTCDDFLSSLELNPQDFNVLLIDSEGPVSEKPVIFIKNQFGRKMDNTHLEDKHCHLMIQTMEAWLIADPEKLKDYYGRDFNEKTLPQNTNVEQIDKSTLSKSLKNATRNTKKGEYHKTRHAPEILERIRSSVVRSKAPNCERLFLALQNEIDAA